MFGSVSAEPSADVLFTQISLFPKMRTNGESRKAKGSKPLARVRVVSDGSAASTLGQFVRG
jgi:hypothetical protein